jgi:hypothetical protein
MKNLIRSAVLVLCSGVLFAQSQNAQTSVGQPTDTNEPVYKGCLTGTKNNYMLTTQDGKSYRLHSDKDIDDHINHNVEVRGSLKKEGADRSGSSTLQFPEIDVADLKSVGNESCTGPAANPSASNANASGNVAASRSDAGVSSQSSTAATSAVPASGDRSATATGTDANLAGAVPPSQQVKPGEPSTTTSTASSSTTAAANNDASALPQSDQPQTDVGGATDKNEPLYKGCVAGNHDKYTLMTDAGDMYRLHSDKDINEHVGDRVEIRGTMKPEGNGEKVSANGKWKGEIDVADIKTVEEGACKAK